MCHSGGGSPTLLSLWVHVGFRQVVVSTAHNMAIVGYGANHSMAAVRAGAAHRGRLRGKGQEEAFLKNTLGKKCEERKINTSVSCHQNKLILMCRVANQKVCWTKTPPGPTHVLRATGGCQERRWQGPWCPQAAPHWVGGGPWRSG